MSHALLQQGSSEWFKARHGKITASQFKRVLLGGEKAWRSYMKELDNGAPQLKNEAPEWGRKYEPQARARFELKYQLVKTVGFITHPKHSMIGASPDFLVDDNSGGEIKCPFKQENHLKVLLSQAVPKEHLPQIQGSMWVTGRQFWWFISYDPRAIDNQQKFIAIKVTRDDMYIQKLKKRLLDFWKCYSGDRDTGRYFGIDFNQPLPF